MVFSAIVRWLVNGSGILSIETAARE